MNKAEILIVSLLVMVLIAFGLTSRPTPPPPSPEDATLADGVNNPAAPEVASTPAITTADSTVPSASTDVAPLAQASALPEVANALPAEFEALQSQPEQTAVLSNELLKATITSRGGGIRSVTLNKYQAEHQAETILTMDFSATPALSLDKQGWVFDTNAIISSAAKDSAVLTFRHPSGFILTRELSMQGDYLIGVRDSIANPTALPLKLSGYTLETGPMHSMGVKSLPGLLIMGIDSLSAHGAQGVRHWGKDLISEVFKLKSSGCRAPDATGVPAEGVHYLKDEAEWISAKNKFFVQILLSKTSTEGIQLKAGRDMTDGSVVIDSVAAGFRYPDLLVDAGKTQVREAQYYVGPKSFDLLKKLGRGTDKTMEFGKRIGWICEWLLMTLNAIHNVIPNYGVAIILLTVIVRLLLWPITAKSTKSMQRMKELQPKLEAIQLKYKEKPQKMNEERMALFKAEKVNPMAGCLPMLFQLPVFFALYTMLQSAIELRFASFLWVHDLSDAEHLFGKAALFQVFPFSIMHGLNILPLLMTLATVWQMKLTPAGGDPQQQQIMKLMPIMMMFMMYNMASGLMLYWTTSTLISILQTKMHAGTSSPTPVPTPAPTPTVVVAPAKRTKHPKR